ncbi:Eco57I restriction-modification methylase domain-containing protein [Streptomyces sp. NPDC001436]
MRSNLVPSHLGERAMANVRALTTLALLDQEERAATPEEQQVLAAWSGWGALPTVFAPKPADYEPGDAPETRAAAIRWQALEPARQELRELLSEGEWADARRNTLNAHYTAPALAAAVWVGLRRLGFDGGHVLEPGSGSGNFIGLAPTDTAVPVEMTGVEVEAKTAGIARRLYPDATVVTAGFEDVAFSDGAFDAVVGNIPYGRYQRYDKVHNKDLKLSIHDHFVFKSLALTRPGGIVALITSRYTLDGKDSSARERMYELGDLVGAVRLPAGAHREGAGTDVVTDVLFLRRRAEGETPGDARWLTASEQVLPGVGEPVIVNDYITAHPQYVLGELRTRIGPFGPEVTVAGERDAAVGLAEAAEAIASAARTSGLNATAAAGPGESRGDSVLARPVLVTEYLTEGALGLDTEGRPTIVEDGRPVVLEVHPEQSERLVQLIGLKARTLALYEAEAASEQPGETPQLAEMRAELREAYRAYRKTNPPPGKPGQRRVFTPKEATERAARLGLASVPDQWKASTAFAFIDDDPDASLLFGLEVWDDRTGKATEQKVLHERVLEPRQIPDSAQTPEDAVALAMEWDGGRLDMSRVASLLGVEEAEAALQVGHLAFRDPAQNGFWEPAARYLSGNVREKLKLARASAAEDPAYDPNVGALERVQPEDLTPAEIKARCGAPWIPVEDYRAFLNHLGFEHAEVRHAGGTLWEVRGAHVGDLARSEWGTPERSAQDLVLSILRQADSTIQVTYRDNEGKTQVNQPATDAAREKARLIRDAWDDWIWADPERSERLAGIYNETFNALILPEYDSSPLTLPGVGDWKMRPHQNAAIRRILSEPTALLAHVVGAGKTATMVGGVMELRRTGLARKPAIVIPNHMLRQITREFREIYPNAKLLAISASDLNVKRRAKFMARVAGGDWDAVVMTHEAFNRVPLRPETQLAYIESEMGSLREQLDAASAAGMHERTIKQIENDLAAVEARMLKQVDDSASGVGVFLEDTGIDYLMVDEAHGYKNLRTISAIPGAGIQGSVKATKLHMVLGHLRKTNGSGRVCTLATGTPIANSVTEAYVLKRYLAPDLLEQQGLSNFDSWAATFGEVVSALEPDAKGDGYKYKARFSRFFNVPELMAAYRSFADVQTAEDLDLPTPPVLKGPDGQRGESIAFPVTGAQREFIRALPHQGWVREPGGVLKALGLGLRASLDMRLIGKDEEEGSKLPYAAEQIAAIWRQTKDTVYPTSKDDPTPQKQPGGLQLVFLDEGTPGSAAANPVDLYDSLREQLVVHGVPRQEIRFVHEASTDRKKEKLFSDCRAGRVSVLVGSTEKMGTGTNIQDRCVALHHLSYPWRPADMAQRDGRVERQGNLNAPWIEGTPDHVRIFYYVTSGSFDEFRLNALARKARFIAQIQRKNFSLREIEDIGEEALNLGMLSALASGDPAILQLAEATADRARMQGLARTWNRQQDSRIQTIKDLDEYIARATTTLAGMREAIPLRRPTAGDAFALTVDGRTLRGRDTAAAALGTRMVALARDTSLRPGERVPVGQLGGLPFHGEISYDYSGRRQLKLRFAWGHTVPIGHRDDRAQWQATSVTEANARGAIVSLENFLTKLEEDADKLEREIATQRGHRTDAANNLRPYEANPYSIQARSKEREEKLLSQLVIINEKKTTLAEKIERAGGNAQPADTEQLKEFGEKADELRALIGNEHAIQRRATDANAQEAPATAQGSATAPGELPLVLEAATAEDNPPPVEPDTARDTDRQEASRAQPSAPHASISAGAEPSAPSAAAGDQNAGDRWETAVRELTAGGLLDERVTTWARANDVDGLAIPLAKWANSHLGDRWDDLDTDDWPEWVVRYFQGAPEARKQVVVRVAEAVHAAVHQRDAQPEPASGASEPAAPGRDMTVEEMVGRDAQAMGLLGKNGQAVTGDELAEVPDSGEPAASTGTGRAPLGEAVGAPDDPEIEAIRRGWLQSQDWWVKAAAEGRSGQLLHLASTPGYVLIERTAKVAEGWEVVPAAGQRIKIDSYTGIASWDSGEREYAEAFAARLDQALRGQDGTPFHWPPPRKWRSADGHKLDRVIAEVRAACDRERGIDSSPGIHQAVVLADRDAQAQAAAEDKKAAAAAKRAEAKAAKATADQQPEPGSAPASAEPHADPDSSGTAKPKPPRSEPSPDAPVGERGEPERDTEDKAEQEADDLAARVEAGEELIVITPDGPGRLVALHGDSALVSTDTAGTRVWHRSELHRPGVPDTPLIDPADLAKRRQNDADAAQAATPAGIVMRYPYYRRLRDLDIEAGHGTIVENAVVDWDGEVHDPGQVVGWVRARLGDNGKRYWWGQDADGGPPDDMPFHEDLPAKSGLPAIRAAGHVRTDMKPSSMTGHTRVITPPYAVREIKLTTAQVALLRTLPLVGTYPDGSELPTPPWVAEHRRYVMSVAQMQALRVAAEAAADTCDTTTSIGRRSRKVLLNAADKLHFEEYETARRGASIPPIGEPDPYAGPYTPRPPRPEPEAVERTAAPAEAKEAALDARGATVPVDVPAPTHPEPAAAEDAATSAEPVVPMAGAVGSTTGDAPDAAVRQFAPQDRVFHDAMRYVVENVSPDGTVIRTIDGHNLPVADVVAEADMPPVITEDLADGWWRFTYKGRSYTATTLPPDLARAHPTAVLNTLIVDEDGQLVGRSFGRPHESAIIWAHAHPGVPHPHVAEWLGTTPTPWPDHTPTEIEHVAAGPPPAEPDAYDEDTDLPETPAASTDATISEDRPTETDAPAPGSPAPDTEEPVAPGASAVEPETAAATRAEAQPSPDPAVASADDLEEHDVTVIPDIEPVAPDVEDPPQPERYTETIALPMDSEFALRLYGWDGQPPESGELVHRDTVIAAVRPSQGGGWFARLSAEGMPADVTSLVTTPLQAAHEGAIYFSALTAIPYGEPIPDAQNAGRLSRADVVRTALRDAASMNRDLITAAAERAWPTTYSSNPHLQHLVERLFEMQNALISTAGARKMAADMEAVEQAAIALRATLPEDPAAPERQHMGYRLAHLLYDTTRLQDHMRTALEATRAEREQHAATTHRDAADEPAIAFPDPPEPQPDLPPDPEMELQDDVREPPPERYVHTTALDEDARFSLRMSGEIGQEPDYGEVLEGRAEFAIVSYSAAGGWYGQITDPATDFDLTPPVATPQEAAHHSAILYSIGYGAEYGEAPAPAQDTETATRADVLRAEMADVAARHRDTITEAAARAWPTTHEYDRHLQAVTDALEGLAVAPQEALHAGKMEERLNAVDAAAMTLASYLPAVPGPERQHMVFPLYHLARDARRLEARLQATAAAVLEEREALRQTAGPEAGLAVGPEAEVDPEQQPPTVTPDQEQSVEASEPGAAPGPMPPRQIPASPQSEPAAALDLMVPAGDRPEGDADPAATPHSEDLAESAVEGVPTAPLPSGGEQGAVMSEQPEADRPSVEEPAPVEPGTETFLTADLPLWTGPDPGDPASNESDAADSDLLSDLSVLEEAVAVLADGGVPHDFREALHDELTALEQALNRPVTVQHPDTAAGENAAADSLGDDAPGTSPRQDADAVNRALAAADQHEAALRGTPEWQEIQTVRGAVRNLWEVIKRQTGVHLQQLMGDGRVGAWWKKTSIRICERIADLAMRAADRLRGDAPEPAACMDRLHRAAERYGRLAVPPRDDESELQKRMRKLGDGLAASQVKVNAARARSTTVRKPPKPRDAPADQPGYLRRTAADPKRGPRQGR